MSETPARPTAYLPPDHPDLVRLVHRLRLLPPDTLLSVKDLAHYLGMQKDAVRKLLREGALPGITRAPHAAAYGTKPFLVPSGAVALWIERGCLGAGGRRCRVRPPWSDPLPEPEWKLNPVAHREEFRARHRMLTAPREWSPAQWEAAAFLHSFEGIRGGETLELSLAIQGLSQAFRELAAGEREQRQGRLGRAMLTVLRDAALAHLLRCEAELQALCPDPGHRLDATEHEERVRRKKQWKAEKYAAIVAKRRETLRRKKAERHRDLDGALTALEGLDG